MQGVLPNVVGGLQETVKLADGTTRSPGTLVWEDSNGNQRGDGASGLDTLGRRIVTTSGSNPILLQVYDSNGNLQTYTVNLTNINISTQFNLTGITEYQATPAVISSIVLPNGQSYQFQYEPNYGGISQINLPTGAYITYTWATAVNRVKYKTSRYISSRTVHVNGQAYAWNFTYSTADEASTMTVTDPNQNQSIYQAGSGAITSAQIYAGPTTGTPVRQYVITYNADDDPWVDTTDVDNPFPYEAVPVGLRPIRIDTTIDNGRLARTEFDYETFTYNYHPWDHYTNGPAPVQTYTTSRGNVTEIREYDYGTPGSGAPGPLLRRTDNAYLHNSNGNYLTYNIVNKVLSQTVYDGLGNQVAQKQYEYDTTSLTGTSNAPQHDYTNYSASFLYRGNASRVKLWRNTDGALLTTTYNYDDLGNVRSIADQRGNPSYFTYNDSWANGSCAPSGNGQAYVTQFTNALSQNVTFAYYPCSGLVQARKDQNDINAGRSGTTSTYDLLGRILSKSLPDGGLTSTTYNDTPPVSVTTQTKIDNSNNLVSVAIKDGLGQVTQTQLTSDPDGIVYTDISYDAFGHTASQSNSYRSTGESTYGVTTFNYDVLGRRYLVTNPGGTTATTNYVGLATEVAERSQRHHVDWDDTFACSMRAGYFGDGIPDKLSVRHARQLNRCESRRLEPKSLRL